MKRIKNVFLLVILTVFSLALIGCAETAPQPEEETSTASPYSDSAFSQSGILMETAFEVYSVEDKTVSYTIANKMMEPVTFDNDFSLEFYDDTAWTVVPFVTEISEGDGNTLPGLQMCLVEVDLSLFSSELPIGDYRIVRMIGDELVKAEFGISDSRISVSDMSFGFEPLSSLAPDYDTADAEKDGVYVLMEGNPKNQDVVQRFVDRVSLSVPAKLRTIILSEEGGTLIRDITFDPLSDQQGQYSVVTDASRATVHADETEALAPDESETTYSFLSIALVENKKKVCLSNYVSYSTYAPEGAPLELISHNSPENVDLVATVEMRTEETLGTNANMFLIFGPDGHSYATISKTGNTFGYYVGAGEINDVPVPEGFASLDEIKWTSATRLMFLGTNADGESHEATFEIEQAQSEQTNS